MRPSFARALAGAGLFISSATALSLDLTNDASIKSAASVVAHGMMDYYKGNLSGNTPGLLPQPYYWWEAGGMFGSLIDYWFYTGDTTYNDIVMQALQFQVGPNNDYMPQNQTKSEGNDDQSFWAFAVLSAAELKFPNPPVNQPQWIALAQGVFNSQAVRWDNSTCAGGLQWQIFPFNNGFTYKNSISNGCFFQIAARLGMYTGNHTYFEWADTMWDWVVDIGLISPSYQVWDGTSTPNNCTTLNHDQWTYNVGVFLYGCAVMWNQTTGAQQAEWRTRTEGLLSSASIFFINNVMYEGCETNMNCDTDQQSFKGYFARWMAASIKVAPWVAQTVQPLLSSSAQAAALSCSGGSDGVTCGTKWTTGTWDGTWGVGQQMSALQVIQGNLINTVTGPVTNLTGGTSTGNPNAGTGGDYVGLGLLPPPITTADKAGAGILTAVVVIGTLGGAWWMISE